MQWDCGKFILKQLDYSPSFSTSDSQRGCASLTICSYKTRARSLIVKYKNIYLVLRSWRPQLFNKKVQEKNVGYRKSIFTIIHCSHNLHRTLWSISSKRESQQLEFIFFVFVKSSDIISANFWPVHSYFGWQSNNVFPFVEQFKSSDDSTFEIFGR